MYYKHIFRVIAGIICVITHVLGAHVLGVIAHVLGVRSHVLGVRSHVLGVRSHVLGMITHVLGVIFSIFKMDVLESGVIIFAETPLK